MLYDGTIQRSASLDNNLYLILAIHNDDLSHQRHWKAEPSSRGRFFIHNNAWMMSLLWQLSRLYHHHHHLSFVLFAKAGCDSWRWLYEYPTTLALGSVADAQQKRVEMSHIFFSVWTRKRLTELHLLGAQLAKESWRWVGRLFLQVFPSYMYLSLFSLSLSLSPGV